LKVYFTRKRVVKVTHILLERAVMKLGDFLSQENWGKGDGA
jgi:hypothetical protein